MGLDKSPSTTNINKFILEISSEYNNDYWLYIAIDTNATLKDLDQFLRDVWLECCGHEQRRRTDLEFYPFKKEELLRVAKIDFEEKTRVYKKRYDFFKIVLAKGYILEIGIPMIIIKGTG